MFGKYKSEDDGFRVHLLQYQDTVDEHWVAQALAAFDPEKISYVEVSRDFLGSQYVA